MKNFIVPEFNFSIFIFNITYNIPHKFSANKEIIIKVIKAIILHFCFFVYLSEGSLIINSKSTNNKKAVTIQVGINQLQNKIVLPMNFSFMLQSLLLLKPNPSEYLQINTKVHDIIFYPYINL